MITTYKVLLAGLSAVLLQVACGPATAADSAGSSVYKNCVDSVFFELKKKTRANLTFRWSVNGEIYATYNEDGRVESFGPDTPEEVLFRLEKQITSDVVSLKDSLVYKNCHGVKD